MTYLHISTGNAVEFIHHDSQHWKKLESGQESVTKCFRRVLVVLCELWRRRREVLVRLKRSLLEIEMKVVPRFVTYLVRFVMSALVRF